MLMMNDKSQSRSVPELPHLPINLLTYERLPDDRDMARLIAVSLPHTNPIGKRIFGNFLEHLGPSIHGGLWAEELANPVFARDDNLSVEQKEALLQGGQYLTSLFLQEQHLQEHSQPWTNSMFATGFGVAALDDVGDKMPFPWAAVGEIGSISISIGRINGAVRLQGIPWHDTPELDLMQPDRGPSGVRQGVFLPFDRTLTYTGDLWARIFTTDGDERGLIEVGLCRRLEKTDSPVGQTLTNTRLPITGCGWTKIPFQLKLPDGCVRVGEPVNFYLRWLPISGASPDLLVDRAFLFASDAVDSLDPEVVRLAKELNVPLLRWPGGNFASYYHWMDGVGPMDMRPPRPNYAWNGLEYNLFGTAEFIHFCRMIGAEPQITVNIGTGSPEEAAAWVEYCNGDTTTNMGRLRARHGNPTPFGVKLWEVGNEIYGSWQGGYHGAEENARRYREFAIAMKSVDPSIELIGTGNSFDFISSASIYDQTAADGSWNSTLLEEAYAELDFLSLHSLPFNHLPQERVTSKEATYSILAQPINWERHFIPGLLNHAREIKEKEQEIQPDLRLAIKSGEFSARRAIVHSSTISGRRYTPDYSSIF
jgi:alpha-N-arabinofuranosidase